MRTDNIVHKTLFTIPGASHCAALAMTKLLPVQRKITGHKQTDAYLWVLEVIQLNEPAHLSAAEEALSKLKITPKEAQKRYSDYLIKTGAHPFQIALGSMNMDDPAGYIKRAREDIEKASQVRSVFGNYEAALEDVQAEKLMLSGELADIYASGYGWTKEEEDQGWMGGDRSVEISDERQRTANGFADELPEPHTLSDVVREFHYWDWLYKMRNQAARELGYEYGAPDYPHIYDREMYLEGKLGTISPVDRQEAITVCEWLLAYERFELGGGNTDKIILNLVGECVA